MQRSGLMSGSFLFLIASPQIFGKFLNRILSRIPNEICDRRAENGRGAEKAAVVGVEYVPDYFGIIHFFAPEVGAPIFGRKHAPSFKQADDIFTRFIAFSNGEGLPGGVALVLGNDNIDEIHGISNRAHIGCPDFPAIPAID
jgi:hypothetical protein